MRYLIVQFYDNDFGIPIIAALQRLWSYINNNNHSNMRSIAEIFERLHESGSLEPMILRLFILENLCGDVEFETRGLYWEEVDWNKDIPELIPSDYLSCSVDFTDQCPMEWQNGECAWMHLETGQAETI